MKKINLRKTELIEPEERWETHWVMDNEGSSLPRGVERHIVDLVQWYIVYFMANAAGGFLGMHNFPRSKEQFKAELLVEAKKRIDEYEEGYSFVMDDPEFMKEPLVRLNRATDDFYERAYEAIRVGDYKESDIFRD